MVYPRLPGTTWDQISAFTVPTDAETLRMLQDLRGQKGWSMRLMSALLGCKQAGYQRWEVYRDRSPSGTARKLIWLLHQTLILGKTHNPLSIATWGKLDGIPLAKLERLIRRTTPKPVAEPERGQGGVGKGRKEKGIPPVSRGGGGVARAQGEGVTRNSTGISGAAGDLASSFEAGGTGFTGKVSEDKVRLANPRKVQVVLGHGRIYRRVKRRTERARKKELGKAYKRVKYEIPPGDWKRDDSWKWG